MRKKRTGPPKYLGVTITFVVREKLVQEAIGNCFCKYDMELQERIKRALDKYARHIRKVSKLHRKIKRKNKPNEDGKGL